MAMDKPISAALYGMRQMTLLATMLGITLPAAALGQTRNDAEKELLATVDKANALRDQAQYKEALQHYQKALDLTAKWFGKDDLVAAAVQNDMAKVYREMGEYAKAEELCQRSLQIREAKVGKDHPFVADALNELANVYLPMGQYAKAERLYQRSLQILETKLGKDHPRVASILNNLAYVYFNTGQYAKAEPLYQRSLQIREAKLGKDDLFVAQSLNNLAILYRDMGQYAKAEPLFQRGLQIREAKLGRDHPYVATSLAGLASLYADMGQCDKAEPLYQRCLQISEAKQGKDHHDTAGTINNLASLYEQMGQYAKAESLYQRCLQILEAKLGKEHPDVAGVLYNLAILYAEMGQYAKAEPLYKRSLEIREAKLGKDHPDVANSLVKLAILHAATGQWEAATTVMDRQRRSEARHVSRVLPVLAAPEQLKFLAMVEQSFANALSLALARRDDPATLLRSAGWVLNAKGVAQQALTERALLERDATDPARRKIIGQLTEVRQQQAALALAMPKAGQETERFRQLQDLAERQQRLEQQLVQAGGAPPPKEWVELDQLRAVLPADAILIDIARFRVANFKAKATERYWDPARYAAWLIPAKGHGEVRLVDLGDADTIDAAVAAVSKGLLAAQGSATKKSVIIEARRMPRRSSSPLWPPWPSWCSNPYASTSTAASSG